MKILEDNEYYLIFKMIHILIYGQPSCFLFLFLCICIPQSHVETLNPKGASMSMWSLWEGVML